MGASHISAIGFALMSSAKGANAVRKKYEGDQRKKERGLGLRALSYCAPRWGRCDGSAVLLQS